MSRSRHEAVVASLRVRRISWALLDGAREPFFSIVLSIVFPPFFVASIAADPVTGTAQWGYALAAAALSLVMLAPVAGVIADTSRRRKSWIGGCLGLAAAALVALWPVTAGTPSSFVVLGLCIVAYVAIELTRVFTDSLISDVAGPAEIGALSGLGVGVGFAATLAYLGAVSWSSAALAQGLEPGVIERVATAATGPWLMLLALPFFAFFAAPAASRASGRLDPAGSSLRKRIVAAIELLRQDRQLARFLLARMAYWDGTMALFAFLTILASTTLDWTTQELTKFGLLGLLGGALAGWGAGSLDARLGARNSVVVGLVGLLLCTSALAAASLVATPVADDVRSGGVGRHHGWIDDFFLATSVIASACLGLVMSSSRSLLARLAPARRLGEYFGLYLMVGRASSFIAPFLVALSTSLSGDQRTGVFGVATTLLCLGIALLIRVRRC